MCPIYILYPWVRSGREGNNHGLLPRSGAVRTGHLPAKMKLYHLPVANAICRVAESSFHLQMAGISLGREFPPRKKK